MSKRFDDPVTAYATAVLDGSEPAGPHVRGACRRHMRDLEAGRWTLDLEKVDRVIRYFRDVLRLNGGEHEGKPFNLLPWQTFIVGSVFGWVDDDGRRRFRTCFIESGKGSGKSPLAAGVGLYMLTADQEQRAEVYAAASQKDQAQILFRDAVAMWQQSPRLKQRLTPAGGEGKVYNLADLATNSYFRIIASDTTQSGYRPHCALLDEVHEHPTGEVVEMMRLGVKGRRQPLIFMITNSGASRQGICWTHHQYAVKICAGDAKNDQYFAYVCALDEGDKPLDDESCWAKANPSLGHTFGMEYLRGSVRDAKGMPSLEARVLRLNFCEWTDAVSPWVDREHWDAAETDFDVNDNIGLPCFGGLDLSNKKDLTAFSIAWQHPATVSRPQGMLDVATWFWTPGDTMDQRSRTDSANGEGGYRQWVKEGYLFAPPGEMIDKGYVVQFIAKMHARFNLAMMAFDQYGIVDLQRESNYQGFDTWIDDRPFNEATHEYEGDEGRGFRMRRHGQGWMGGGSKTVLWMPRSVNTLEEQIVKRRIRIKRNPVLRWNSSNALLKTDPSGLNRRWEKTVGTGRIDGMPAMTMAVGAATEGGLPVYTEPGQVWTL